MEKEPNLEMEEGNNKETGPEYGEEKLDELEKKLLEVAKKNFGPDISPSGGNEKFKGCFTHNKKFGLVFWFNTPDHSTHTVSEKNLFPEKPLSESEPDNSSDSAGKL